MKQERHEKTALEAKPHIILQNCTHQACRPFLSWTQACDEDRRIMEVKREALLLYW
jgi:hypothetical protein